jgi:hypothetical protein
MKKIILVAGFLALMGSCYGQSGNRKLVTACYRAYEQKDWSLLRSVLSPGFKFCSPDDDHINLATYHSRCWPNSANTKKFDLEKVIMGSDDAFVTITAIPMTGKCFGIPSISSSRPARSRRTTAISGRA